MTPAYLTIHGSHAYGLNTVHSDVDKRGFFFAKPEHFFGLDSGPEQIEEDKEEPETDYVMWEFRKFVRLAANSNPNIIETLFTDIRDVRVQSSEAQFLRHCAADWFLSRKVETTYGGYARQQFGKLSRNFDRWEDLGVRKDTMHCVRLIFMAEEMLTTGNLTVKFDPHKHPEKVNLMLGIRRGQIKPVLVHQWAQAKLDGLADLRAKSVLPEEPKLDTIEAFVQQTLRSHYCGL